MSPLGRRRPWVRSSCSPERGPRKSVGSACPLLVSWLTRAPTIRLNGAHPHGCRTPHRLQSFRDPPFSDPLNNHGFPAHPRAMFALQKRSRRGPPRPSCWARVEELPVAAPEGECAQGRDFEVIVRAINRARSSASS